MAAVNFGERIPNNVDLASDRKLQRALERWQPKFLEWWNELGPVDYQDRDIYLRTAIAVGQEGWAHFDYVKMPDYRWGIFLAEPIAGRTIAFGDELGRPAWRTSCRPSAVACRPRRHRTGVGRAAAPPVPNRTEPL
jgi:benzoyl-CoA 2,3-epoxidase subunit B